MTVVGTPPLLVRYGEVELKESETLVSEGRSAQSPTGEFGLGCRRRYDREIPSEPAPHSQKRSDDIREDHYEASSDAFGRLPTWL